MVRVLVVEDDPDDALLTRSYLDEAIRIKFETEVAASPGEALVRMAGGEHDICLLDYRLGPTDGLSVYAEARAGGYSRPVILLTGQGNGDVADIALEAGVSDFIEKARVDSSLLERVIRYSLERKRIEQEITALNHSLERRVEERTAALVAVNQELEEFSRSVSHDLRGPLRTIIATSGILIADHAGQLDEEGLEMLRRQQAAGNRLAKLIDDLLRLSRLTHQEMVWVDVDLSGLVAEVADELSARVWNNAPQFTVQPGVQASGDRTLLRAVLQNLMENACKFSPDGARVAFGAHEDQSARTVFFVSDSGVGFDMQYVGKVFKPFERLVSDTEFEGTGIGLANVERIVRRHGGEVWAESSLGRGTTIFFTLGV